MKKLIISGTLCAVALLGGSQAALAEETTTTTAADNSAMLTKIQDLMKMIADLQAKLAVIRGEVQELTKDLSLGAKDDDVLKIQEILASDPALFGVKPTGYFGPMTEAALKKFQERYGLEVTGKLDAPTRDAMKELRKERKDGRVPDGLIKSDEVKDRIKARLQEHWDEEDEDEDAEDMDDEDDSDDDSSDTTKEEAVAAIKDAQEAVDVLKGDLADLVEADNDEDAIDEARDNLKEAQKKLFNARRALAKGDFDEAVEKADDSLEASTGEESSDDDEDDDSDDSGDEDENDDEEDEDEDDD